MRTGRVVMLTLVLAILVQFGGQAYGSDESGKRAVRFVVIGDRAGEPEARIYEQILEEAQRLQPEFMVTVGDMIVGYTEDSVVLKERWDEFMAIIEPVNCPLYFTTGNNDAQAATSTALYRRYIGDLYRSFDQGDMHFVMVNNSMWDWSNELPAEQLDWLAADLETNRDAEATFVFMHKPFWYNTTALGKPDTLHSLFVANGVDAVFTGHFHNYFAGEYDGIKYTGIGSSGGHINANRPGPGYHFAWVTVDDKDIAVAPITIDAVLPWDIVTPTQVATASKLEQRAARFTGCAPVAEDLTVPAVEAHFAVHNLTDGFVWDDTLHWEIPDGWTVEPTVAPLHVEPGESAAFAFQLESVGDLYPLPSVSFRAAYTPNDTLRVEKEISVGRRATCRQVTSPPSIDGNLSEDCWDRPVTTLLGHDAKPVDGDSTYFYFAYDDKNLYLAARCLEADMSGLVANMTERDDAVYSDDCAGFMIQPDIGRREAYQIYVNSLKTIYDQRVFAKEDGYFTSELNWSGEYEVAASTTSGHWAVELRFPMDQIGASAESGAEWGISFRRKQQRTGEAMHFQAPWSYNTETYGRLVFE